MTNLLSVQGMTHRLGGAATSLPVLSDIDLEIDDVRLVALAGRSGSGKSTLCHLIAGLGSPSAGSIRVAGQVADEVDDWALVSLLPQRLALVEELSIRENVLLPTVLAGRAGSEEDADRLLEGLGLASVAGRPATATSLGEQQRAALARALVLRPRLAVLDEPTGHQDDANVVLVQQVLAAARDGGTTILVATHDDRVLEVADQVVHLQGGRIVPGSRASGTAT